MTTIYDIIQKRKALEVYAKMNGHDIKFPKKNFSAHEISAWRTRFGRSRHINDLVDCLYKAQVKKMFPDLTRVKLKEMIKKHTRTCQQSKDKKGVFIRNEIVRKYRRLLPLPKETYEEIGKLGPSWNTAVSIAIQLSHSANVPSYMMRCIRQRTFASFWNKTENPHYGPQMHKKEKYYAY